jgi:hypothetical protein
MDLLTPNLENYHPDIVVDDQPFANPARKYQQVLLPSLDLLLPGNTGFPRFPHVQ